MSTTNDFPLGTITRSGQQIKVSLYADRYQGGTLALIARNQADPSDVIAEVTAVISGPVFMLNPEFDVIVSDKCPDEVYDLLLDSGLIEEGAYTQARRYPGAELSMIHSLTDDGYVWVHQALATA